MREYIFSAEKVFNKEKSDLFTGWFNKKEFFLKFSAHNVMKNILRRLNLCEKVLHIQTFEFLIQPTRSHKFIKGINSTFWIYNVSLLKKKFKAL